MMVCLILFVAEAEEALQPNDVAKFDAFVRFSVGHPVDAAW